MTAFASLMLAAASLPGGLPDCAVGSYEFADGQSIDIGPSDGRQLRWRRPDGTSGALTFQESGAWESSVGWTGREDGILVQLDCETESLVFDGERAERVELEVIETVFEVEGATLAGRLVLPPGDDPVPIVVLVHGAERTSALEHYALQRQFPAAGIGAFVYDKRGTGSSTGRYTHDYLTLATDVLAAVEEARRLAADRATRIGLQAGSQGGWVAPLAAKIKPPDFVIVSFGLAVSPIAAERELIAADVRRQGYGDDAVAEAMEIVDAVEEIIATDFRTGYDELAAVRHRFHSRPWFSGLRGSAVEIMFQMTEEEMKKIGPSIAPHIPVNYDPMPVLRNLNVPQLWLLAGQDIVAPPGETSCRLQALREAGQPVTILEFERAEHGMYEFETAPDGTRTSVRAPAGYFATMHDFIRDGSLAEEATRRFGTAPQLSSHLQGNYLPC